MLKTINLQLFAEGDTNPDEKKEANLDNKPDEKEPSEFGLRMRQAFGLQTKSPAKEPDKKPDEKKPEEKKPPEPEKKEPETKEPEKKEPETKEPPKELEKEEFITLKVLGKEVQVPASERDKYMQMGYDYPHVKEEAKKTKELLQRAAKIAGFNTVDEYMADLDKQEKAKLAEKIEEAAGDPDKIDEIVKSHPVVVKTQQERQELDREKADLRNNAIITDLKKDRFFAELEPEFAKLMEANPTVSPDLLYKIVRSDYLTPEKLSELMAKEKESAVKATIADQHDKERRAAPTGGDTADTKEEVARPSAFASKISSVFGVSATKVAQRSQERLKQRS